MKTSMGVLVIIMAVIIMGSSISHAQLTCSENVICNEPGYSLSIRNNGGHGIVGYSRAFNGKGVLGRSDKERGIGVFGLNPRSSGTAYGVYGSVKSPDGVGVYGTNTGGGYAGYFEGAAGVTDDLMVDGDVFLGKADESTRYIKMPRTLTGNNGNLELQAGGVTGSSGTAFQGGNIVLRAGDLNAAGAIWAGSGSVKIYAGKNHYMNNYNGDIIFYAGNNYEERMRIVGNNGRVGIGTTSPNGALDVNGSIYQRGGILHADYVFEPDYNLENIEEHAEYMWKNKHLKAIPRVKLDENGLEIIEVGSHQKGIVEELEKAHIYIEELHKKNKVLEERLAKLEAALSK